MSMMEQARMLASLAQLKSARSDTDIVNWFNNNPWIYVSIEEIVTKMKSKLEIVSCDKTIVDNDVVFVVRAADSKKIYKGIKDIVSQNIGLVSKFKIRFSVNIVDTETIEVKLSVIPGKTDSFMLLLDNIDDGIRTVRNNRNKSGDK